MTNDEKIIVHQFLKCITSSVYELNNIAKISTEAKTVQPITLNLVMEFVLIYSNKLLNVTDEFNKWILDQR